MNAKREIVRGDGGELEIATDEFNPERIIAAGQAQEAVYETFAFLTTVVIAHVFDEMSLREIAELKGRKLSEVTRAWRQAKNILREHL